MPRPKTPPTLELSPSSASDPDIRPAQDILTALAAAGVPLADLAIQRPGWNDFGIGGFFYCTVRGGCRKFARRFWFDTTTGARVLTDCCSHDPDEYARDLAPTIKVGRDIAEDEADRRDADPTR